VRAPSPPLTLAAGELCGTAIEQMVDLQRLETSFTACSRSGFGTFRISIPNAMLSFTDMFGYSA
jgi:hypothetical protein